MTYYDLNAESCLISAVFKGDVEEVTQLINNKVDINYQVNKNLKINNLNLYLIIKLK
jgi:hypothetical protein